MNSRLNSDFDKAIKLITTDSSREELFDTLRLGTTVEKQISAIKLNDIKNEDEAEIFISNLTKCDGKIREVVALKFYEFSKDSYMNTLLSGYPDIVADATIDIDSNVCRYIIDSLCYYKDKENFVKVYLDFILGFINDALQELTTFSFKDKKYKYNKQYFKLYWCLEALCVLYEFVDKNVLKELASKCIDCPEYTIREKIAKLIKITKIEDSTLITKLENDENYYVKNINRVALDRPH